MEPHAIDSELPIRRPLPQMSAGAGAALFFALGIAIMAIGMSAPVARTPLFLVSYAMWALSGMAFVGACFKVLWAIARKLTTHRDRPFMSLVATGNLLVLIPAVLIGGAAAVAMTGFNMVKDDASNSVARLRVWSAQGLIEEWKTDKGRYPTAEEFARRWTTSRADDYLVSPWGGTLRAPGILTMSPLRGGHPTAEAAIAAPEAFGLSKDRQRAAWVVFARIEPPGTWRAVTTADKGRVIAARDYLVAIYGPDGTPWWSALGGDGQPHPSESGD